MESFPSYDYPLLGNTPESAGLSGSEDFPYGADYGGAAALTPAANATAGSAKPAPAFTLGVVFDDLSAGAKKAGGAVTGAIGGAYNTVAGSVKGVYWNLIGGVAIIGIIAIVVLGMSGRFMRQMESGK
jgi:hypothetical protein